MWDRVFYYEDELGLGRISKRNISHVVACYIVLLFYDVLLDYFMLKYWT